MDDDDRLFDELASIPQVEMRMEWEARVRARCHRAMSRRRGRPFAALIDLAAVAALCVYLVAVLTEAARLAAF